MAARRRLDSRSKGKRGELAWVNELKALGHYAERTVQRSGRGGGPFDVLAIDFGIPNWEVKLEEKLNVAQALDRAAEDAGDRIWAMAWKRKYKGWYISMNIRAMVSLIIWAFNRGRALPHIDIVKDLPEREARPPLAAQEAR